jgi:CheY-like chemotaxis protein
VTTTGTAAEATALCKEWKFDLLVADLALPDGDVCDLMRALAKTSNVRGIAFSVYGNQSDITRALEAGFSAYLVKPVGLDALESTIGSAINETSK